MNQVFKKRKKSLLIRLMNPDETEVHRDVDDIAKKLLKVFKNHIGRENAINSYELFRIIYDCEPDEIDVFQRNYLWGIIKAILTKMRSREELFVVNNTSNYFVLQSKEELKDYHDRMDRVIHAIKDTKRKAKTWVKKESWRNI